MNQPLVSVLMPVYNAEAYVAEAVESILQQSYTNFEFIILEDGSTDDSLRIVQSYADSRIRLYRSKTNKGLIYQLNRGLQLAQGKYVARMDADDVALPERLERQLTFLENHPEFAIVGAQVRFIFGNNRPSRLTHKMYFDASALWLYSLFYCPFIHSNVTFRTKVGQTLQYDSDFYVAEDYHRWVRMLRQYPGTNLPEVLAYCRFYPESSSARHKQQQLESQRNIYKLRFSYDDIFFTRADLDTHLLIPGTNPHPPTEHELRAVEKWLQRLLAQLQEQKKYEEELLAEVFYEVWNRMVGRSEHLGIKAYWIYRSSPLFALQAPSLRRHAILFLRCLRYYPIIGRLMTWASQKLKR